VRTIRKLQLDCDQCFGWVAVDSCSSANSPLNPCSSIGSCVTCSDRWLLGAMERSPRQQYEGLCPSSEHSMCLTSVRARRWPGASLATTDVALIPLQRPCTIRFPDWHKLENWKADMSYPGPSHKSAEPNQKRWFAKQLLRHVTVNTPHFVTYCPLLGCAMSPVPVPSSVTDFC
jgi:hypothetical protein